MNDQPVSHERSNSRAHFHARLTRYRNLLFERWWMLVLGAVVGLAIEGALVWYAPPSFSSLGRHDREHQTGHPASFAFTEELSNFLGTQAALMQSGG